MSERYFYHPATQSYWETITEPSDAILTTYPEGTINVPQRPAHYYDWVNGEWIINEERKTAWEERLG